MDYLRMFIASIEILWHSCVCLIWFKICLKYVTDVDFP